MKQIVETDKGNLSVLYCSHDGNSDLWFLQDWSARYEGSYFPRYVISNIETRPLSNIGVIKAGIDHGWHTSLKNALVEINTPLVMISFDDLIARNFSDRVLKGICEYIQRDDVDSVQYALSSCRLNKSTTAFYKYKTAGQKYYFSLVYSVWKSASLMRLLSELDGSPWEFELNNDIYLQKRYAVVQYVGDDFLRYDNCVVKGQWDCFFYFKYFIKGAPVSSKRKLMNLIPFLIHRAKLCLKSLCR